MQPTQAEHNGNLEEYINNKLTSDGFCTLIVGPDKIFISWDIKRALFLSHVIFFQQIKRFILNM